MRKHPTHWPRTLTAIAVSAMLSVAAPTVFASGESTGTIVGMVNADPSLGAVTISIESLDTGLKRTETVAAGSEYRFPRLPIGRYKVTVSDARGRELGNSTVVVNIATNTNASFDLGNRSDAEVIEVIATRPSAVDMQTVDSGLVIGETEFDRLPVGRDVTSIALLAPNVTKGDTAFGNLGSFAGASVAENAYYINGMNVTNFRNGLGGSTVPFEFYKEFQVKTGGYGAEFGRSLGGVINAVTKSGGNEFEVGGNVYHTPGSLQGDSPNSYYRDGRIFVANDKDETTRTEVNVWASGPLVQDKLFFFAMYNPRDVERDYLLAEGTSFENSNSDDAFWGGKLDWQISDNHLLELLTFSDEREDVTKQYNYDYQGSGRGDYVGSTFDKRGGKNSSLKYTGYLSDSLTVTALYGQNEYDLTTQSTADLNCPLVVDVRPGAVNPYPGCWVNDVTETGLDQRTVNRLDFEWIVSDAHTLRFGVDRELLESDGEEAYSGGQYWRYIRWAAGTALSNGEVNNTGADIDLVRLRERTAGGAFETDNQAIYIEDRWQINDRWFATIGLRHEVFENKNANGDSFIKVDDQIAPRIGLTWDVEGDGKSKLFFNAGRYHLPVANNTNVRVAGNEIDWQEFYTFAGMDPVTGAPTGLGPQIGDRVYTSSGAKDVELLADKDIKPMYQDEFILGYERELSAEYTFGIRGIYRDTGAAIDDWCVLDQGCVLINPGEDVTVGVDADHDGVWDGTYETISAEEIGLDDAHREYHAVNLELNHRSEKLRYTLTYTWARNFGNFEGYVKSDIGQDDAGITQDFDFPELMDGAEGYLPNDRRHTLKFYGSYSVTDSLDLGWNFLLQSGRPINGFGKGHPDIGGPLPYGDSFYTYDPATGEYRLNKRGHFGRTPWIASLDLSARYHTTLAGVDTAFYFDVFNVLNADGVIQVDEEAEQTQGVANDSFMLPTAYQEPRSVRVGAEVRF